jgi:SAM-dependent methyltransferase
MVWDKQKALKALSYNYRWIEKFCNSILKVPYLYDLLSLHIAHKKGIDYWKSRKEDGKRGILNYIELSPTSYPLLDEIKFRAAEKKEMRILDLGCNCGRHLNALREMGFNCLYGVDVNPMCKEVMRKHFPALCDMVVCNFLSFEQYLPGVSENYFDIIFTHGKTIEHVTPRFSLVRHLCRSCKKYIILGNVGLGHGTYPRFWIYEFQKHGFALVKLLQPEKEWAPRSPTNRPHSLCVFEKIRNDL